MLKSENVKAYIKDNLLTLIRNRHISDIGDLDICEGLCTSLIYPTDDFFLYKDQFDAVMQLIINDEKMLILQVDWDNAIYSSESKVYSFDKSIDYLEYRNIWLDYKTLIFSDSFKWVIVIDECVEGGIGILVADSDIIERFESFYKREKIDIVDFFEFHIKDEQNRKQELPIISIVVKLLKQGKQK